MKKQKSKEKNIENMELLELSPEISTFESLDPFKNCNDFLKFYRTYLKDLNKDIVFYDFDSERRVALDTLDTLILNNRTNVEFLREWIKYYYSVFLKGNNVYKKEKTSLKAISKTFEIFNNKYLG